MAPAHVGPFQMRVDPNTLTTGSENRLTFWIRNLGKERCERIFLSIRCMRLDIAEKHLFIPNLDPDEEWKTDLRVKVMTEISGGLKVPIRLKWKEEASTYRDTITLNFNLVSLPEADDYKDHAFLKPQKGEVAFNSSVTTISVGDCFDLEVRIHSFDSERGVYPIEASLSTGEQFRHELMRLDLRALQAIRLESKQYGESLFNILFANSIRDAYMKASANAETRTEKRLRLRLWIDPNAIELHTVPWEILRVEDIFLAASATTPFSRYLPATKPWGIKLREGPLRVLAALSNPIDLDTYRLSPVDVEAECVLLDHVLADQDVQLDFLEPPVTLPRLEAKLREGYHVLHYVGHGAVGKEQGEPALYLQQGNETTELIKGRQISAMVARQGVRPRLVVLSACESATVATQDVYVALGPQLIQSGIPAVVAMQGQITQSSARDFSQTFYTRLLAHGIVDIAMNEARSTLLTTGRHDAAVPVLFMRLRDGRLW